MGRYRVVLRAAGYLKLTAELGLGPDRWQFTVREPIGDVVITIEDVMTEGVISHVAIQVGVDLPADGWEAAVEAAGRHADLALAVLSAAGRAGTGSARPVLAFDSTPNKTEREFVQWHWDVPIPMPKTSVPREAFLPLLEKLLTDNDEKRLARVALSMSWHRRALGEQDSITRFLMLWIALEALAARLAEKYEISEDRGYQSLRRLAAESGGDESNVSKFLRVRRSLLHRFGEATPAEIQANAEAAIPEMERLLIHGWCLLLLDDMTIAQVFPTSTVRPYPTRVMFFGTVIAKDLPDRDLGNLPYFIMNVDFEDSTIEPDGTVTTSMPATFTFTDTGGATAKGGHYEIWGLSGPTAAQWQASEAKVVPAEPP